MRIPLFIINLLVCPLLLSSVALAVSAADSDNISQITETAFSPSVSFTQSGLSGEITADILSADLDADGADEVLVGTTKGLYIISAGVLKHFIPTSSYIIKLTLLDDLNANGSPEIAVSVGDIYFPNVRCYDGATAEKIWEFAPSQEVFTEDLMWTELQTMTYDLEAVDINADGIKDVVATSGYFIYGLNGKNGEQIWKAEAVNNVWDVEAVPDLNSDGIADFAVGGQFGNMYLISGRDGIILWREQIAQKANIINDKGSVWASIEQSIWNIIPLELSGMAKALVSAEDGKVRLVDLAEGNIEWETSLIDYVGALLFEYYQRKQKNPTSPGDYNFFNLQIVSVPDVTGDRIEDVLALSYAGRRGGQNQQSAGQSGLFLLNSVSGDIIWQDTGMDLKNTGQVETATLDGEMVLMLPQANSGSKENVELLKLTDGSEVGTMQIKAGTSSFSQNAYRIKKHGSGNLLLASDYGDLICIEPSGENPEVVWDYPRITEIGVEWGDFTGDDAPDILVRSKSYPNNDRNMPPLSRVLFVIDGTTQQKQWLYEMPYDQFAQTGGIDGLKVTPDLNGDGKQDIIGFVQPSLDWGDQSNYGEDSHIIAISGKDGSVFLDQPVIEQTYYGVWEELYTDPSALERILREYTDQNSLPQRLAEEQQRMEDERDNRRIDKQIISLDILEDRNGNTPPYIIVGCMRDIFVIDVAGELIWTQTYEHWRYDDPFTGENHPEMVFDLANDNWNLCFHSPGDINKDGIDDAVVFSNSQVIIASTSLESQHFNLINTIDLERGIDSRQGMLVDDLDNDGIQEILYPRHRENESPLATYVSPVTGQKLFEAEYEPNNITLDLASADFDGDGYRDTLKFRRWTESGPNLQILSGRTGNTIWNFAEYRQEHIFWQMNYNGPIMPACPVSDISGDGIADLALVKNLTWQPGAQVDIIDIPRSEVIQSVILEEIDLGKNRSLEWHPSLLAQEVGDFNGDGVRELAAITIVGEDEDEKEFKLMVVDIRNGKTIADFNILGNRIVDTGQGEGFAVTGSSGEFYFLNVANDLEIVSPAEGTSEGAILNIEWRGVEGTSFNQVFIDGNEVGRTNGTQFSLPMTEGNHELKIRSLDEYGRGVYQTAEFSVSKSSSNAILAILFFIAMAIIALFPATLGLLSRYRHGKDES